MGRFEVGEYLGIIFVLPLGALCIRSALSSQWQICAYLHCETCWIKQILLRFCRCIAEAQRQFVPNSSSSITDLTWS